MTSEVSDAELISAVRTGDLDSYGELFARHRDAATRLARQLVPGPDADDLVAESFAKVMTVLQAGKGPDEFFRAYLLTSIRRLHIDRIRAGKRLRTTGDEAELDRAVEFVDPAEMKFEQQAAAEAFASLPERWQMVLWHLDVEGQKPAQVAPLLGMTANSVSALAYRAREGLRAAYLQSHLAPTLDDACKTTTGLLGQYVRQSLRARDTANVEKHLDTCSRCSGLYLELVEVNGNLSGLLAPALLGTAAAGYLGATGTLASMGALLGSAPKKLQSATSNSPVTVAAVGAATLAVVAGVVGIAVVASGDEAPPAARTQPSPSSPPSAPAPTSAPSEPAATKPSPEDDDADLASPPSQPPPFVPAPVDPEPQKDDVEPTTPAPTTKPTPRPTKTPRPSPTPTTPAPTTPTPLGPTATNYSTSVAFTDNPDENLERQVAVAVSAGGEAPRGNTVTVSMSFDALSGPVTFRGGSIASWNCDSFASGDTMTAMTCSRVQTGSSVPAIVFSVHGVNPGVRINVAATDNVDSGF
ncbi:sigma-70 family RNA polymerase sigma factor [Aeromicrobium sp. UC242_57]|uniref:sigma-70 family RNA polymerase sigma factor n=1 Tax=Aeromicrobium sp. UC242_57 TaxID=3374624 RepID=UPI0037B953A2